MASAKVATPLTSRRLFLSCEIPPRKETTKSLILDFVLWQATSARLTPSTQDRIAGLETIVDGLLSSHRKSRPDISQPLGTRLYLCQLATIVFGRFDDTLVSETPGLPLSRPPPSEHPIVAAPGLAKYEKAFAQAVTTRACRRHQTIDCKACVQHKAKVPPGLIHAIPAFLKVAAYLLRKEDLNDAKTAALYSLLLSLMTQAAIEAYLCDAHTTLASLLEIFSYGDIDPQEHYDEEDHDDHDSPDDFLLWEATSAVRQFRSEKTRRIKEFLVVPTRSDLGDHMMRLANKYPLDAFHNDMRAFCQTANDSMGYPSLASVQSPRSSVPAEFIEEAQEPPKKRLRFEQ